MRRPGYLGDLGDTWFGNFGRKANRHSRTLGAFGKGKHRPEGGDEKRSFAPTPGPPPPPNRAARPQAPTAKKVAMPASEFTRFPLIANAPAQQRAALIVLATQCTSRYGPTAVSNVVRGRNNKPEIVCMVNKGSYSQPTRLRLSPTAADQAATTKLKKDAATGCSAFTSAAWKYGQGACKQCIAQGGTPSPYGAAATKTRAGSTSVYCDIPGRGRVRMSSRGQIARNSPSSQIGPSQL